MIKVITIFKVIMKLISTFKLIEKDSIKGFLFCLVFQGASATNPSYYCDIKLSDLRSHGKEEQEHNFLTSKCNIRDFEQMKCKHERQPGSHPQ